MEPTKMAILNLDSKIFRHILSFLIFEDQLKLSLITDRINDFISDAINKEMFDIADIQLNFTLQETKYILMKYGSCIKQFRFEAHRFYDNTANIEYLKLLSIYCPNLEEICFSGVEITPDSPYAQFMKSKNIKTLRLRKSMICCSLLSELTQLEVLHLEESRLKGRGLHRLKQLTDFTVNNCLNFKCKNLMELCKCNQLKRLSIVGYKNLTTATLRTIIATQTKLEVLNIGNTYYIVDVAEIFELRSLREVLMLDCPEKTVADIIKGLASHQKDTLACLEIYLPTRFSYVDDLIETGMLNPICELQHLKVLSLRNSALFENNHLVAIARACKQIEMLDLSGTCITDLGIIGCAEYLKYLRYLDISYCHAKRNLYLRLVETRQEVGFTEQLVVYIKPQMELATWLKSDEYTSHEALVKLKLDYMRLHNETSMLQRLDQLNNEYRMRTTQPVTNPAELNSRCPPIEKHSLSYLNVDCLYHIIKHLGVIEKFNLILTTRYFDNIVEHYLRTDLVHIVDIISNFTLRETSKILARCGHMIKRLHLRPTTLHFDSGYFDLIPIYCRNLEELQCEEVNTKNCVESCNNAIAFSSEHLRKIIIDSCEIDDTTLLEISKAHNLHTLFLKHTAATGIYIGKLTHLIHLDVRYSVNMDPEHLIAICKSNQLKWLDIQSCERLNGAAFQTLIDTQCNLEQLTIGGLYAAPYIHIISKLQNLKGISLRYCTPFETVEVLDAISEARAHQIQFLELTSHNEMNATQLSTTQKSILTFSSLVFLSLPNDTNVDNAYIKRICKACPLLELFEIYQGENVTDEGILWAVKTLKSLRVLNIKYCNFTNVITIYQEILKIKKSALEVFPLVVHVRSAQETIFKITETKDYQDMRKYVVLSAEDVDRDEYLRQREHRHLQCIKKRSSRIQLHNGSKKELETSKLLDLPRNCLFKIVSYLGTIDKLKFAYSHDHIFDKIQPIFQELEFDMNEMCRTFTLEQVKKCAQEIRRVKLIATSDSYPIEYLKLIYPTKDHLKEVYLDGISPEQIGEIQELFTSEQQQLEKIILKNCQNVGEIFSVILNARGNVATAAFGSLSELHLTGCDTCETDLFTLICQNSRLKCLDIRGCSKLLREAFNVIVETQNDHLEWLGMSCCYSADNYSDVSLLENLKHIDITYDVKCSYLAAFLDKLIKFRRHDLTSLRMASASNEHADCYFEQWVRERCKKFRNLQTIEIYSPLPHEKPYVYQS